MLTNVDTIVVVDIETTINAPVPHFGATPAYPGNFAVMFGYRSLFSGDHTKVTTDFREVADAMLQGEETLLVGHNLAFDLYYLLEEAERVNDLAFLNKKFLVWDTQKFHYMATGRSSISPSLEYVAESMAVPFKKDVEIKERFKAGIGSDKIDRHLLADYLVGDVEVTNTIFEKQVAMCKAKGEAYFKYMLQMMQGIAATTEMSRNGIRFDSPSATKEVEVMEGEQTELTTKASGKYARLWPAEAAIEFNINSSLQVETLLWGGHVKTKRQEIQRDEEDNDIIYKTGKRAGEVKMKWETGDVLIEGLADETTKAFFIKKGWETKGGASTLKHIQKYGSPEAKELALEIIEIRKINKSISTYFKPYIDFEIDGKIHPNYNHNITQTGRLSSSKPNMQNISGKK